MSFKKIIGLLIIFSAMLLVSCDGGDSGSIPEDDKLSGDGIFTENDFNTEYDSSTACYVSISGNRADIEGTGASFNDGTLTIGSAGDYVISGSLIGNIRINADNQDKLHIILAGLEIESESGAPILIENADKVFITLEDGSENRIISKSAFDTESDNIDAAIFSREDLTINGSGSLFIDCYGGCAISSKDDLSIIDGIYTLNSLKHGIEAKDALKISAGSFSINSGRDGIHAENNDDETLGYVFIADGSFEINASGDGISSSEKLQIEGGNFLIYASEKGLKSGANAYILGGVFEVSSKDDSLHSNAAIYFSDARLSAKTDDDGIHADAELLVESGTIEISDSYEGLEGLSIEVRGGEIRLTASDDGFNAAGGNDGSGFGGGFGDKFGRPGAMGGEAVSEDSFILISGGIIYINASGDGVDSNGDLCVTGGETYISGPTNGGNGALDYAGNGKITGGIFIALGSYDMAMNFSEAAGQGSILLYSSSALSGEVRIFNSDGEEIFSFTPEKTYSSVLASIPNLVIGEDYRIEAGGAYADITLDELIYGSGGSHGGMPGGGPGGRPR